MWPKIKKLLVLWLELGFLEEKMRRSDFCSFSNWLCMLACGILVRSDKVIISKFNLVNGCFFCIKRYQHSVQKNNPFIIFCAREYCSFLYCTLKPSVGLRSFFRYHFSQILLIILLCNLATPLRGSHGPSQHHFINPCTQVGVFLVFPS